MKIRGVRGISKLFGVALAATVLAAATAPDRSGGAPPPLRVSGNHLVAGSQVVRLLGVNRSGSEYACAQGWGIFQGPVDDAAVRAIRGWGANAVAIPLNEQCWLGINGVGTAYGGAAYRNAIVAVVERLNAVGIYAVLRLSVAAPGAGLNTVEDPGGDSAELPMADADHAPAFWASVATTFNDNGAVAFHLYDEPHHITWECWQNGCMETDDVFGNYQTASQQSLVDAVRNTGAQQPILVSGIGYAGDFSEWLARRPSDPHGPVGANVSTFDYGPCIGQCRADISSIATVAPVVTGGFGDTDCNHDFSDEWMRFADSIGASYLAWTWNTTEDYGGCHNALLEGIGAYYSGAPTGFGIGIRDHLRSLAAVDQGIPAASGVPTLPGQIGKRKRCKKPKKRQRPKRCRRKRRR